MYIFDGTLTGVYRNNVLIFKSLQRMLTRNFCGISIENGSVVLTRSIVYKITSDLIMGTRVSFGDGMSTIGL